MNILHLFLEGPVKTGKSTLIRECLTPYRNRIGGFSSQRLWLDGQACGYRLTPASEFMLDAPFDPKLSGIFTYRCGGAFYKDLSVFKTYGVELLSYASARPLILMDEIGGLELLTPTFRKKLYEVLDGPVPCIGVLKLAGKAEFMGRAAGNSGEVADYNRQLRSDLTKKFGASLLPFNFGERDDAERRIKEFLEEVF